MQITSLGHSCIQIRSNEVTLITDPYDSSLGISMGNQNPDIVTVSHQHPHHSHLDSLKGKPKVLQSPGEYEFANFYIVGIGTDRNDPESSTRKINTIYVIQCEGVTLCHLGDLYNTLSPREIEELGHIDVLFIPAGGGCTIDPSRAADLVNVIGPSIVIPIHFQVDGIKVDIQPLDGFLKHLGVEEPSLTAQLSVTDTNLPRDLSVVTLKQTS